MGITQMFYGDPGQASQDMVKGYQNAQNYMQPYYEGGKQAYGDYSGYLGGQRQQLDQYGNPADWMWSQINQDPASLYQTFMAGYNETPQAQYEQQQMMKAATQGAAASGMLGGGQFFKDLQQNTADIVARDQDRYFNNILNTNNQQRNYLNDYRGVQQGYMGGMSGLAQMGQEAAGQQGQYAIGEGNARAQGSMAPNPWVKEGVGLAGRAASYFGGR